MKIKVYPTSDNSLNIIHPTDGPLRKDGSEWTNDGFTCRMLSDNAVTDVAPVTATVTPAPAPSVASAPAAPAPTPTPAPASTQAPSVN